MRPGAFTGLTGGTIQNLTGQMTGALAVPISGFANFTGGVAAPVTFDVTAIDPGVGSVALCSSATPGAICMLAGSPLTFLQLSTNAVAFTLFLEGVSYTGMSSSGTAPTRFVFSSATPITGTIPGITAQLVNGGSITGLTYSASATAVAPEPAALVMIAVGLVILLAVKQRAKLSANDFQPSSERL